MINFRSHTPTACILLAGAVLAWAIPQLRAQEGFGTAPFEDQASSVFEKEMVDIPPQAEKSTIDASDFRDPFFFLIRDGPDPKQALTPGTTVDGLRFNTYSDTQGFIDRYYKNSNFVLKDVYGRIELVNKEGGCLRCHRGIEKISRNHPFSCIKCHSGNLRGKTVAQAHKGMVSNPSDLKYAQKYCGKCHEEQVRKVKNSLMTTARGIIEITREAWGERPLKQPKSKKRKKGGKPPPVEPWQYVSAGKPVDDFLQKKCLRCHVQSASPHRAGDYRGTGCASCHMVYTNEGTSLTRDRAIQEVQRRDPKYLRNRFNRSVAANSLNNRRGYPLLHKFTVAIPSVQCEHCHNNNGVGNEFEGLFGKAARPKTAQAQVEEDQPVLYGRDHEFLLPDIHREKGMHCIDCHGQEEIKADSHQNKTMHDAVRVRCETCHGTNSRTPEGIMLVEIDPRAEELIRKNQLNPNLMTKIKMGDTVMVDSEGRPMPHVLQVDDKWVLYSKVTGKEHEIPLLHDLKPRPYAHQILGHMKNTECSACHARWSASEWGMHVIREEAVNKPQWQDWSFADPTLQQQLWGSGTRTPLERMLNWNSAIPTAKGPKGSWVKGIWSHVFTETGWNSMILGKNQRNRYTIMKPRYQYFLTTLSGADGRQIQRARVPMTLRGRPGWVMAPHTPHTIRSTTRPCESCHANPLAAGLGDPALKQVEDGKQFLNALKRSNRVLPQFQIKQMVSRNGWNLQNPLPQGKLRFMKSKEINALLKKSDRYRAYRYLDLRRGGLSRLLIRDDFPYDLKHKLNEEQFGAPTEEETLLYYDLDQHRFFETQKPEPAPEIEAAVEEPHVPALQEEPDTFPAPPQLDQDNATPNFFIDLIPGYPAPTPPSLPEKGVLDNEQP